MIHGGGGSAVGPIFFTADGGRMNCFEIFCILLDGGPDLGNMLEQLIMNFTEINIRVKVSCDRSQGVHCIRLDKK